MLLNHFFIYIGRLVMTTGSVPFMAPLPGIPKMESKNLKKGIIDDSLNIYSEPEGDMKRILKNRHAERPVIISDPEKSCTCSA